MPGPPHENPGDFIRHARTSWLAAKNGRRLHAVGDGTWTAAHRRDMAELWLVSHPVRLACGQLAELVMIAGPFSRMNWPRCAGCCRATGMPRGVGAPVNDRACRVILGFDEG